MKLTRRAFSMASAAAGYFAGDKRVRASPRKVLRMRGIDQATRMRRDAGGNWTGCEVELARALCDGAGYDLEMVHVTNWSRSLKMLEEGDIDLLTAVSYRESRTSFLDYVGPFDIEELVILVREENGDARFETLDDFTRPGRLFQIASNAAIEPEFDRRMAEDPDFAAHFITAAATAQPDRWNMMRATVMRVQRKRIFGAITDWYSYRTVKFDPDRKTFLGTDPSDIVGVPGTFAGRSPTYIAASLQTGADIRAALHESYRDMRESGAFEAIWERWFPDREMPPAK
ncbi:MAG: transporter substrate-binding domain-containing protein [Geminicoccaceae bacterium]